jgi:toxin-antitoxin system PIN domain toxin
MISLDTNLLLYARKEGNPFHTKARSFLEKCSASNEVVIAELVLVEFYVALRNPAIMDAVLSPEEAVAECQIFSRHPRWQLAENAEVMTRVWKTAAQPNFARSRIFDLRIAKTLQAYGVTRFATANTKDFEGMGFKEVLNPLLHDEWFSDPS